MKNALFLEQAEYLKNCNIMKFYKLELTISGGYIFIAGLTKLFHMAKVGLPSVSRSTFTGSMFQ